MVRSAMEHPKTSRVQGVQGFVHRGFYYPARIKYLIENDFITLCRVCRVFTTCA